MYHPTTRVLATLEMLQSRQRVTGRELAERLEVDERTARRYITMLQDLGIPIEGIRGRHGAYVLRPGYKLPPLMLTDDEALAIVLGLVAGRRLGLTGTAVDVEGALAKIERVLPDALRARVQALQGELVINVMEDRWAPAPGEMVVTMGLAARERRRVRMRYRAKRGEETRREVDPYGVVFHGGGWYATGHCHLRGDRRLFRLDRVVEAELTDERFERPDGFDVLADVLRSLATVPDTWAVEARLLTTMEVAVALVPADVAVLEEHPDGVTLRCFARDLDWMARMLARLPVPFAVVSPPELRPAVQALAARLLASLAP